MIVIGGGAFFYFYGQDTPTNTSGIGITQPDPSTADQTQILSLLNQIRSLRIDSQLFLDPAYTQLYDYSVVIPERNVGRPNPFAPLPGETTKSKTATPAR